MSVHVGEVSSTVEMAPAGPASGGAKGPGDSPLSPTWKDLERYRAMCAAEAESQARTAGAGFDA
jgi:hypothetical protein